MDKGQMFHEYAGKKYKAVACAGCDECDLDKAGGCSSGVRCGGNYREDRQDVVWKECAAGEEFKAGDRVRVRSADVVKALQEGKSPGWNVLMEEYCGMVGEIYERRDSNGAFCVDFEDGEHWWYVPETLESVAEEEKQDGVAADQNTCVVDGVEYVAAVCNDDCEGCVADGRAWMCTKLGPCSSCSREDSRTIIWKPAEEPKQDAEESEESEDETMPEESGEPVSPTTVVNVRNKSSVKKVTVGDLAVGDVFWYSDGLFMKVEKVTDARGIERQAVMLKGESVYGKRGLWAMGDHEEVVLVGDMTIETDVVQTKW